MIECLVDGEVSGHISAGDRGLHYGDGLFETIAVIDGQPRFWQGHMDRLAAGCVDRPAGFFELVRAPRCQRDLGACLRERRRELAAQAAARACDERPVALEAEALGTHDEVFAVSLSRCRDL